MFGSAAASDLERHDDLRALHAHGKSEPGMCITEYHVRPSEC